MRRVKIVGFFGRKRREFCHRLRRAGPASADEPITAIYRVRYPPTEAKSIVKPDAAEIKIGDYGWEPGPCARTA